TLWPPRGPSGPTHARPANFTNLAPFVENTAPFPQLSFKKDTRDEPSRVPVEGPVCRVRHSGAAGARRAHVAGSRRRGRGPRGLVVGRQGPGACGRPRQGGRRQARTLGRRGR